jgi:hypothetical protein
MEVKMAAYAPAKTAVLNIEMNLKENLKTKCGCEIRGA